MNLDGMADRSWISIIESVSEIKMKCNWQFVYMDTDLKVFLILIFTTCPACTTFP